MGINSLRRFLFLAGLGAITTNGMVPWLPHHTAAAGRGLIRTPQLACMHHQTQEAGADADALRFTGQRRCAWSRLHAHAAGARGGPGSLPACLGCSAPLLLPSCLLARVQAGGAACRGATARKAGPRAAPNHPPGTGGGGARGPCTAPPGCAEPPATPCPKPTCTSAPSALKVIEEVASVMPYALSRRVRGNTRRMSACGSTARGED